MRVRRVNGTICRCYDVDDDVSQRVKMIGQVSCQVCGLPMGVDRSVSMSYATNVVGNAYVTMYDDDVDDGRRRRNVRQCRRRRAYGRRVQRRVTAGQWGCRDKGHARAGAMPGCRGMLWVGATMGVGYGVNMYVMSTGCRRCRMGYDGVDARRRRNVGECIGLWVHDACCGCRQCVGLCWMGAGGGAGYGCRQRRVQRCKYGYAASMLAGGRGAMQYVKCCRRGAGQCRGLVHGLSRVMSSWVNVVMSCNAAYVWGCQ